MNGLKINECFDILIREIISRIDIGWFNDEYISKNPSIVSIFFNPVIDQEGIDVYYLLDDSYDDDTKEMINCFQTLNNELAFVEVLDIDFIKSRVLEIAKKYDINFDTNIISKRTHHRDLLQMTSNRNIHMMNITLKSVDKMFIGFMDEKYFIVQDDNQIYRVKLDTLEVTNILIFDKELKINLCENKNLETKINLLLKEQIQ